MSAPATIAPEIIACIAENRTPSMSEVNIVADHIWADMRGARSAFSWNELESDSPERLLILKAAQTALAGEG